MAIDINDLNDEQKINMIRQMEDMNQIQSIIYTLSIDAKAKEELYDQILSERRMAHRERRNRTKKNLDELSDNEKIEMFLEEGDSEVKDGIINSLDDNSKMQLMDRVKEIGTKADIIKSLSSDEMKMNLIEKINIKKFKVDIIKTLSSQNAIKMLENIKEPSSRRDVLQALIDSSHSDEEKVELLNATNKYNLKDLNHNIAKLLSDKVLLEHLEDIDKDVIRSFRSDGIFKIEDINANMDKFMTCEGVENSKLEEKKEMLNRFNKNNEELPSTINFDFLDEKNVDILSEEKFEQIACYPDIQKKFLSISNDEKKCEIFNECLNNYVNKNNNIEWTKITEELLNGLNYGYDELINDIDNIEELDKEKLTIVLSNSNIFNIKNLDEFERYDEIKENVCTAIMNGDNEIVNNYPGIKTMSEIEQKRLAVLEKRYGQDLLKTTMLVERYGDDLDSISLLGKDEKQIRDHIINLKEIINETDEEKLENFFNNSMKLEEKDIDSISMESKIKSAYAKEYNKDLLKVENLESISGNEEVPIYNAGTDFKMLITSVAAYHNNHPEDYEKDWNRNAISSQGFCASYIRNDMLGTAPIPHICYGFNEMSDDSLMLSGPTDIYSDANKMNATSNEKVVKFLSPSSQIDKTEIYNEMLYKRMQNGERKQLDYIVVFAKDGNIPNIEEAKKAQRDWGKDEKGIYKMPIVVVDINECIRSENEKVDKLMEEYKNNPTTETAKEIFQKVRNNRVTTKRWGIEEFREDINLETFQNKIKDIEEQTNNKEEKIHKPQKENEYKSDETINEIMNQSKGKVRFSKLQEIFSTMKSKIITKTNDKFNDKEEGREDD